MRKIYIILLIALLGILLLVLSFPLLQDLVGYYPAEITSGDLDKIILPEGFSINYYAQNITGARSMALSENGILYVGTRSEGNVYAILDENNDHKADRVIIIASGLNQPNGVAIKNGDLYIAEVNKISVFKDIDAQVSTPKKPIIIRDDLPEDQWHGWKFIRFAPDGKLYVPVGAPCNVCEPREPYASILRMDSDGSNLEVFATGIRNTVGFDFHPITSELWFTDNGRDWWGEDVPPDELNHAPKKGLNFGFPYCHGTMVDDEFNADGSCDEYNNPIQDLGPHVAALGMRFYQGEQFPKQYTKGIFIAEHGSWNRKVPIGYRISFVELDDDKPIRYTPFAEGWLQGNTAWGRPVDVQEMPDGSLLVSDDANNAIYRIVYESQ